MQLPTLSLSKIGFKNYRVFEDKEFEFKPITILTGTNSAGKSSIVKALMLLQANLEQNKLTKLDFHNLDAAIAMDSFISSVRTQGSTDTVEFKLTYMLDKTSESSNKIRNFNFWDTFENLCISYRYDVEHTAQGASSKNAILVGFEISLTNSTSGKNLTLIQHDYNAVNNKTDIQLGLSHLLEYIVSDDGEFKIPMNLVRAKVASNSDFVKEFLIAEQKRKYDERRSLRTEKQQQLEREIEELELKMEQQEAEKINIISVPENQALVDKRNELEERIRNSESPEDTKEELEGLNQTYYQSIEQKIANIQAHIDEITQKKESLEDEISKIAHEEVAELSLENPEMYINDWYSKVLLDIKNALIKLITSSIRVENNFYTESKYFVCFDSESGAIKESVQAYISDLINGCFKGKRLGDILTTANSELPFIDKLADIQLAAIASLTKDAPSYFVAYSLGIINGSIGLVNSKLPFAHIAPIRGKQSHVYNIAQTNFPVEIAAKLLYELQQEKDGKRLSFLKEQLKVLAPDMNIRCELLYGSFATIELTTDGNNWRNLADFGLGYSQVIPIFIFIAYHAGKGTTLFIEEPGSHLHPDMQAKLVDVLINATEFNEGKNSIKFVLETHSEYMLRKLQYQIAHDTAKNLDTKILIHYLHRDPQQHKTITIDAGGDFVDILNSDVVDAFGDGFFDESRKWAILKEAIAAKKTIIFCENLNEPYFNLLKLENVHFLKAKDKTSVQLSATEHTYDFFVSGLIDRDYLADEERDYAMQHTNNQNRLFILKYYCFENYLYHPENIQEVLPNYDVDSYRKGIVREKNEQKDKIIHKLSASRNHYYLLKSGKLNLEDESTTEKKEKSDREKGEFSIIKDLSCDDFEVFYKHLTMKDFCSTLKQGIYEALAKQYTASQICSFQMDSSRSRVLAKQYTVSQMYKKLASTEWFKKQIEELLKPVLEKQITSPTK